MAIDIPSPDPIEVSSWTQGTVKLKWLSLGTLTKLEKLHRDNPDRRAFTVKALHLHLLEPDVALEDFAKWDERDLHLLAQEWANRENTIGRTLDTEHVFGSFRDAVEEFLSEQRARMRDSFGGVFETIRQQSLRLSNLMGPTHALMPTLKAFDRDQLSWKSNIQEMLKPVTLNFATLHSAMLPTLRTSGLLAEITSAAALNVQIRPIAAELSAITRALRSTSDFAQAIQNVAGTIGAEQMVAHRLAQGLTSLTERSHQVWQDWGKGLDVPSLECRWLREAPAFEIVAASGTAVAAITSEVHELPSVAHDRLEAVALDLRPALEEIDEALLVPYNGAIQAVETGGVDFGRHFSVSARELLTHTLHKLAPDDTLKKWPEATPDDYHNGRPTRRLRVRYILRQFRSGAYARFVEDDIRRTVDLLEVLNSGTHRLDPSTDEPTLRMFLRRVEGVLGILLEATRASRHG